MKNIKTIQTFMGRVKNPDDNPENWQKRSFISFDEKGNVLEETLFQEEDTLESKTFYKYDDHDRIIEKTTYLTEDEVSENFKYTYNESGLLFIEKVFYSDGSLSIKTTTTNKNEFTTLITDDDGEYEGKEISIIDQNNRIIEFSSWDNQNIVQEKIFNIFNNDGRLIERTEYGLEEEFIMKRFITYDEKGNQIKIIDLSEDNNLIHERTGTYDENNFLIQEQVDNYIINYEYNELGKKIRDEIIDPAGNIESFTEYNYDDNTNLSLTIACHKGNLLTIETGALRGSRSAFIVTNYVYDFYN